MGEVRERMGGCFEVDGVGWDGMVEGGDLTDGEGMGGFIFGCRGDLTAGAILESAFDTFIRRA